MVFLNFIIAWLTVARDWFLQASKETAGWIWPFRYLSDGFYTLYQVFFYLAFYFGEFNTWLVWAAGEIRVILSWETIKDALLDWLPKLEDTVSWFLGRVKWFDDQVDSWWSTTAATVKDWIDITAAAIQAQIAGLGKLVTGLQTQIDELDIQSPGIAGVLLWFSDWWGQILKELTSWWAKRLLDIGKLIDTAFADRDGLWSGWQDMRSKVIEFFQDPLEFLWQGFTNWFLGPEE